MEAHKARFWEKVDKSGDCWIWTATTTSFGYGYFRYFGRNEVAHRVSYEWEVGEIPEGLVIDHLCRVPECVNPEHLEPVTQRENLLRGNTLTSKHAAKTHCPQGHEYTKENTYIYKKTGSRYCRKCRAKYANRRYHELKKLNSRKGKR